MADRVEAFNITKFDGNNYKQWKFQMKCILRAKGVYNVADGTMVKPEQAGAHLNAWLKNDAIAMCILTSALELKQITIIENCESAKEILNKLDSVYEQKSEVNKMLVHEKFHAYKMDPNDSIAQHVSKIENLAQQIKDSGEAISDAAIMTKILSTLPQKFRYVRQAWFSLAEDRQNIANLTARLLDEEANLKSVEETEKAFAVMSFASGNSGKDKPKDSAQKKEKGKMDKSKITCYNCQKKGHFANECRNRRKIQEKQKRQPTSDQGNFSAFIVQESQESCSFATTEDDEWKMDSGASSHMTYRREFFSEFSTINDGSFVSLGNNLDLEVKGIGTVRIKKNIDGIWYDSVITKVLYVPDLRRNLFSEGIITEKGLKIVKEDKYAYVYEGEKLIASAVRKDNRLYTMQFKTIVSGEVNITTTENLKLWHDRLGHVNQSRLLDMAKNGLVEGINLKESEQFFCEPCVLGKQHRLSFPKKNHVKARRGERIYSDVCGPFSVSSVGGANYFVLFKDEFTGYRVVSFVKHKSDVIDCLKTYVNTIRNKYDYKVKFLHVDNGTEYINQEVKKYLSDHGIQLETTAPYTPEQNGRAERDMRTIVESARSMIHAKQVPLTLWAEAVNTAVYLLNRTTSTQSPNSTPYELWTGKKADVSHTRTFGCTAYMHVPDQLRSKLKPKSVKMIFVGYDGNSNNYRLYDPKTHKIKISRNVVFNELAGVSMDQEDSSTVKIGDAIQFEEEKARTEDAPEHGDLLIDREINVEDEFVPNQDIVPEHKSAENKYGLRSRDGLKKPKRFQVNLVEINIPQTYQEAKSSPEAEKWTEAISEELSSLEKNDTWDLQELPEDKRAISSKWVFKVQHNKAGQVSRFKARLCARGFSQKEGIDYFETYAPTTRYDSIRVLLSIAAHLGYRLVQFDIKTAFLHGDLEEEIYMIPPDGLGVKSNLVCRLKKSLYGLKQSSRCWNTKFDSFLKDYGFIQSTADKCVYKGLFNGQSVFLIIYVDDGLIIAENEGLCSSILNELEKKFEITVGVLANYVGMEIEYDTQNASIFIHQTNYIRQMLRRFNMEDATPVTTPADPHTNLYSSEEREIIPDDVPLRQAVGSLMFAAIVSRPDIMFAVSYVSRFVSKPESIHWNAVKRIFKYLKDTADYGIQYSNYSNQPNLVGFSDSDFANDTETRRSTSGYVFMLNGGPVTWSSQRQRVVALSTTEAEYLAASAATKEAVWLKHLLRDINQPVEDPITLKIDNQSAIRLVRNPEFHKRTKHIDTHYHFIREKYQNRDIDVTYVPSNNQIADIFTKPLPRDQFHKLRQLMGINKI